MIMVGMIGGVGECLCGEFVSRVGCGGGGGMMMLVIEVVCLVGVIGGGILLVEGVGKVGVEYGKGIVGNKEYGGGRE